MGRFSDKVLVCRDCGKEFVFTAGEQEFYATRGFTEPTRCTSCRQARKAAQGGGVGRSSSDFGSSREGSYSPRGSAGGGAGTKQMFKVVCADCGQETEVPFEPRSGRPVYCRTCFDRRSGGGRR